MSGYLGMYTFRLETLLQHRKHDEEKFQKDLALARTILEAEKIKLKQYRKLNTYYSQKLEEKFNKGYTASEIICFQRYLDHLAGDIENQQKKVHSAEDKFEQKRQELLEAVKKRKVLEKLKHREMNAYKRQEIIKEQAITNEAAAGSHRRKR